MGLDAFFEAFTVFKALDSLLLFGIIEKVGTRTCVKRNAVFGARLRVFLSVFSKSKRESDMYQNGLGYISDTYPNLYPPVTVPHV